MDEYALRMIVNTSVQYAQYYIKRADLETLREALRQEKGGANRTSLVHALERRIRCLEREAKAAAKEGAS